MEEIDLKELIDIFLKRKFLIIFVVILFAICGALYTLNFITPMYNASTSMVLVQAGGGSSYTYSPTEESITTTDLTLNSKLVENYREIALSKSTSQKVIDNLNLDCTAEELQKQISVSSITDTEFLKITITDEDPIMAQKIAYEVANVFMDRVKEIYNLTNVHILDLAEVPTEPSNIHLGKNVVIFAFVGFVLVSGYLLLVNMLDTTVKSDSDIEKATGLPVLASIVLMNDDSKKRGSSIFNSSGEESEGRRGR